MECKWIGYVVVATDKGKSTLGRRDVVVAWCNTILAVELHRFLVQLGWISIYTLADPASTNNEDKSEMRLHELGFFKCLQEVSFLYRIGSAGISSAASVPQTAAAHVVASNDAARKYCTMPDPNRTYALQCNFCNKILTSGVTRMKFHLAGIKKYNVAPCQKVPRDVKEEMKVLLLKSNDVKDKKITEVEKLRSLVNIDHSEGEQESDEDSDNDVLNFKHFSFS
ncbi:rRNA N-glycosidase [Hordeum vulgare]|nr:rRNA N-glycosidase [Hordeum vulgare]